MLLGHFRARVFERVATSPPGDGDGDGIREASIAELPLLAGLLEPGVDHEARLERGDVCLVSWEDEDPVGIYWIALSGHNDRHFGRWSVADPDTAYLNQLKVLPGRRRRGIGTQLARHAAATAAAHGRRHVRCLVDPTNRPSVVVHQRAGFRSCHDVLGVRVGAATIRASRRARADAGEPRPRRILLVINRLADTGGAEVSTGLPLDRLQGNGFEFGVLTLFGEAEISNRPDLEARGMYFWSSGPGLLSQMRAVNRAISVYDPDLIHASLFDAELASRLVALVRRVPVLASIVNMQYSAAARASVRSPRKLDAIREVDGFLARHATTHFMAITQAASQSAQEALRIPPPSVTVVPRGRDRGRLGVWSPERRERTRRTLGIADETPVLLNVARQEPQKGQADLVEAFGLARDQLPSALLLIAGREGTATPGLLERCQTLGLDDAIRFLGVRADVADLLCAADLFVFTSKYEGLGGAVLEAMAMRLPIVAFDIPPVREVLEDTGALVRPGDVRGLAASIVRLLNDPDERARLADGAVARFDSHFDADIYVNALAELYRRLTPG